MTNNLRFLLVALLCVSVSCSEQVGMRHIAGGVVTNEVIVSTKAGFNLEALLANGLGGVAADKLVVEKMVTGTGMAYSITGPKGAFNVEEAQSRLLGTVGVKRVEPNRIVSAVMTPNDPDFGILWGLQGGYGLGMENAWDSVQGSPRVTVGVIDSGIDCAHPDLYLNAWLNQLEIAASANLVDSNNDGLINFVDLNAASNAGKLRDQNGNG